MFGFWRLGDASAACLLHRPGDAVPGRKMTRIAQFPFHQRRLLFSRASCVSEIMKFVAADRKAEVIVAVRPIGLASRSHPGSDAGSDARVERTVKGDDSSLVSGSSLSPGPPRFDTRPVTCPSTAKGDHSSTLCKVLC